MRLLKDFAIIMCLMGLAAPMFMVAIIMGENKWYLHDAAANASAATWEARIAIERAAGLIGEVERDEPQTLAVSVKELNKVLRTTERTVAAGRPLLRQATQRAKELERTTDAAGRLVIDLETAIEKVRDEVVPHIDSDVQALYPVVQHADAAVQQMRTVATTAADALPLWTDCDHNPSCAFNLFQGTAKSVERMAQAWERATPATAKAVQETTEHAAQLSKPGWFTRLLKRIF